MHVRRMPRCRHDRRAVADRPAAPSHGAARFKNCTAMNKVYPHGVGRMGARDKTSGTPVTNFKVSNRVYAANRG